MDKNLIRGGYGLRNLTCRGQQLRLNSVFGWWETPAEASQGDALHWAPAPVTKPPIIDIYCAIYISLWIDNISIWANF